MRTRTGWIVVALCALAIACDGGGYITYEREPTKRPLGDACVLNDDCDTGRCIGGVCADSICESDDDCLSDELCVFGECEPADDFACTAGQRPLMQVSDLDVAFGEVALGNTGEQTITIENRGDCLLTLSGVGLASNMSPGFACEPCDPSEFPQRVPPQRSLDVTVSYSPPGPGEAFSELIINSDDDSAGEDGIVGVDLHATYSGVPVLVVHPLTLPFGNVPQGSTDTREITITNEGSGNAVLTVTGIYIGGADREDFAIPSELAAITPTQPLMLPPHDPDDPDTVITVPVTIAPTVLQDLAATLNVEAHTGDPLSSVIVKAELTGSSLGPPQINVSATELVYRQDDGLAYTVGTVAFRQVTISNSGQSALSVEMSLFDPSNDFSISPPFVPPIAPGGAVVVSVFYNPSEPSDPVTPHDPQSPVDASMNITSNDTDPAGDALKVVALRGWARGGVYDDVLKLELNYENADNSWAGNDFRDVDLELVSPLGFSCGKPAMTCVPNGDGCTLEIAPNGDFCAQWNSYDPDNDGRPDQGTASWIALGQYEEPERILLFGLGQDLANGQTFTARAHYIEDCANIPSGLLGDLLGIGGSLLLGVLGGAIGVPIAADPATISDFVTQNCWDHASSLATLHVYVNGDEIASPSYRLRDKGDCANLIELQRQDGQFVIASASPTSCN